MRNAYGRIICFSDRWKEVTLTRSGTAIAESLIGGTP